MLLAVNLLNFYDRQVIGAVAKPLADEFGLSDTFLGLLTTVFTLVYAAASLPLGHWADVGRQVPAGRRRGIWSVLTALTGAAWNVASLYVFRLGVGIGEASCACRELPPGRPVSTGKARSRALAIFMVGLPLGLSLSSLVSGWIAGQWGWRAAFVVAGVPGLVVALLCLKLPEPARGASEGHAVARAADPGIPCGRCWVSRPCGG